MRTKSRQSTDPVLLQSLGKGSHYSPSSDKLSLDFLQPPQNFPEGLFCRNNLLWQLSPSLPYKSVRAATRAFTTHSEPCEATRFLLPGFPRGFKWTGGFHRHHAGVPMSVVSPASFLPPATRGFLVTRNQHGSHETLGGGGSGRSPS